MQTKTDHLAFIAEKTGLRISKENTKVMRPNSKQREKINLKDVKLDAVHSFTNLESIVTSDGGAGEDVKSRIGKDRLKYPKSGVELNFNTHINQPTCTHLHHQCEVSSPTWFRDLESDKIQIKKAANLH